MRSKLFVPGSRPDFFSKALNGPADGLSFDLEDSVREDMKASARKTLAGFLVSSDLEQSTKTIVVRVNALDSGHFEADLEAVVCAGVDVINLPKAESIDAVQVAAEQIERIHKDKGLAPDRVPKLLLNIETPRSLRLAHALADAHPTVMGLQIGLGDLFEPFGIERRQPVAVAQVLFTVAMAAHEKGRQVYDGAFANVADKAGFEEEARLARSLGFHGKSCIHPSQVEIVNMVFRPTDDEISFAQKVVLADEKAQKDSVGAYMVDGRMIDAPFVDRARAILAQAEQLKND